LVRRMSKFQFDVNRVKERMNAVDPPLCLEIASFYSLHRELLKLVDSSAAHLDQQLANWYEVYTLLLQRAQALIPSKELLQLIQYKASDDPDLFIIIRLLHAYACYDLKEFGQLRAVLSVIEKNIDKMQNKELQAFYRIRLNQILANYELRKFNLDESRRKLREIIASSDNPLYVSSAYHTLGLSYLYDDYDQGIDLLRQTLELYNRFGLKRFNLSVRRSIVFYNNYWGRDLTYIIFSNHIADIHERVHYEYRIKDIDKAKKILERIDVQAINHHERGFHFYYKGLIHQDADFFYKSMSEFKHVEDKFYANLSRIELHKLGERPSAIEAAFH
jgi:hypothetical protein